MMTTCVASQKLESSTARIISRVSPLIARWCATIKVQKPTSEAIAAPMPFLKNFSIKVPSSTAPQPTKTAEE